MLRQLLVVPLLPMIVAKMLLGKMIGIGIRIRGVMLQSPLEKIQLPWIPPLL
jgi:hypothetical protein